MSYWTLVYRPVLSGLFWAANGFVIGKAVTLFAAAKYNSGWLFWTIMNAQIVIIWWPMGVGRGFISAMQTIFIDSGMAGDVGRKFYNQVIKDQLIKNNNNNNFYNDNHDNNTTTNTTLQQAIELMRQHQNSFTFLENSKWNKVAKTIMRFFLPTTSLLLDYMESAWALQKQQQQQQQQHDALVATETDNNVDQNGEYVAKMTSDFCSIFLSRQSDAILRTGFIVILAVSSCGFYMDNKARQYYYFKTK